MKDKHTFLTGLAAGAIGGLLVRKRMVSQSRRVPYSDIGQQVLAETRGEVKAALLAARVQARYDELYAHRPRFHHPALRQHLEMGAMPILAIYHVLCEESHNQEAILAEIDRIVTAIVKRLGQRKFVQIMGCLPDPFKALRIGNRWAMKWVYPPEGWRFEWVEDSNQCIAYNTRECFYVNVLTAYGAPELTAHLCVVDDLLFGDLPGVSWERTMTLSRGADHCDFRFCRVAASSDVKT